MATWYIFNKKGQCVATMVGAMPSESDLASREEYAVLDEDDLGSAGELMRVGKKIKKVRWIDKEAAEKHGARVS